MLRPYKPFLARQRVIEGPDGRCRPHRRTAEDPARAVAAHRRCRASHPRVHRVRSRDHRAAAVRARRAGRRPRGPTARLAERSPGNPDARKALVSLSHRRGTAMVASSRTPLRIDRLRAVNTPQPVALEWDESGALTVVKGGKVEAILESWRIDDEWWRQTISRAYMDVMLEGGKRRVLFQDLITGQWFAQLP